MVCNCSLTLSLLVPLLVHCVQGVSRSATVVTAYLVRHAGMTLLEAATLVRKARWQAMPNINFWRCLRKVEMEARGGASTVPAEAVELLHWSVIAAAKGQQLVREGLATAAV